MRNAETILAIIRERSQKGLNLEGLYRHLYNPDLYLESYCRLYRNDGAMTQGSTKETVDGMSQRKIDGIIELLREERYRWAATRRTYIPKSNGKQRPLGIPTWSDKLLQDVMRSLLEAYYEPQFSRNSHGFRPEKGCHTALRDIYLSWTGVKWFIEGDIKGCFDNIDHKALLTILHERINDNRFLILVERLLQTGYLEQWTYRPTLSGTPQGGVISPLFANIYLDKLDKFVEGVLIPEYTRGELKRRLPIYDRLISRIRRLKLKGATESDLKPLRRELRFLGKRDPFDPGYRRLRYIRYADDFLLGLDGPKEEAEEIKGRIRDFLRDHLKLELSEEKTLISHSRTEKARFLGYHISTFNNPGRRGHGHITLRIPPQVIEEKVSRYATNGWAEHRPELIDDSDFTIVALFGSELRGYAQYYAYAQNRHWLHRLQSVMRMSLLKTLASKHKTTTRKMARKYTSRAINSRGNVVKCLSVVVQRPDKPSLVATFGGHYLGTEPFAEIEDFIEGQDRNISRNELKQRLMADVCELCGSDDQVQVHHVRKLADLQVPGRKAAPSWKRVMAARRRKTLVVCGRCHDLIHAGQPTPEPSYGYATNEGL